jgi:DNA-directed RNA polymerase specialized sigma24 family protein
MCDSLQTKWPPLAEAYLDVTGPIDADIYNAAGEIWPRAAAFAKSTLHDEPAGQITLQTVCARITAARSSGRIQIEHLKAYIFRAYEHEVLRQLQKQRLHDSLILDNYQSIEETGTDDDVEKKILIEQILARMDTPNRHVFELLALGYSFEEIGRFLGKRSNKLRSAFSKQLNKIKKEIGVSR